MCLIGDPSHEFPCIHTISHPLCPEYSKRPRIAVNSPSCPSRQRRDVCPSPSADASVSCLYPGRWLVERKRSTECWQMRIGFAHILLYLLFLRQRLKPLGNVGLHGGFVRDAKVFHCPVQCGAHMFIKGQAYCLCNAFKQSAIADRMQMRHDCHFNVTKPFQIMGCLRYGHRWYGLYHVVVVFP